MKEEFHGETGGHWESKGNGSGPDSNARKVIEAPREKEGEPQGELKEKERTTKEEGKLEDKMQGLPEGKHSGNTWET